MKLYFAFVRFMDGTRNVVHIYALSEHDASYAITRKYTGVDRIFDIWASAS